MEIIHKLENLVAGWLKNVPHLPANGQKWLGKNVWWIVLIGAIVSGIAVLFTIGSVFTAVALLGAASTYAGYYVAGTVTGWLVVSALVSLAFLIAQGLLLALAVNPLKAGQKKGWTLLFGAWLVNAVSVVVSAILSMSILGFITGIIFGAIGLAIGGYFLFEIHGQFGGTAKVAKKAKTVKA